VKPIYLSVLLIRSKAASLFVCILFAFNSLIADAAVTAEIVSVKKIWDAGRHNAFTDLIRFENRWYCSFREADDHVGGDGQLRLLTSIDGETWVSAALLGEPGIDLRDPKLSITADGRLMIVAGGSVYKGGKVLLGRQPRVAFSKDGKSWSPTQRVLNEGDWLWRVTWHKGKCYGIAYDASKRTTTAAQEAAKSDQPVESGAADWKLKLFSSDDGVKFELITCLDVPGHPNETTIRFLSDDTMVALIRREGGDKNGWIGSSRAPYKEWKYSATKHRLGGPNFIVLPDGQMLAGSRVYPDGSKTILSRMTTSDYEPILGFPSGGDNSYPGFVWHDGLLWMSYYSSHEGKTSIYLAKVRLKEKAEAPIAIPPTKPNIVFIMADDLGWADVAFHGGNSSTPNLDRLAREGLELAQHYVAPVCSPTRTGLMTGRCWSRFGVTSPQNNVALPRTTVTLPLALKSVGYETCLTGKWHLGSLPNVGPNHFGFDHSYGSLAGGVSPWNHRYKQGKFEKTWHRNETLIEESGHVTDLIAAEAIRWIEGRGTAPFFLYVPFTAVHLPVKEPKEWLQRVPPNITGDVARHYAASVMHLDDAVGRIVVALEMKGVRKNTMLVFTSDNGGSTAENNDLKYPDDQCPNGKLPGNNKPWRGGKGELYEGGTRVPTIVSWPERAKSGSVNSPVQITDWMPTFCSLVGFKSVRDLKWDGTNITALLDDHKPLADRPLYAVAPNWRSRSLRHGQWKLIVFEEGKTRKKTELYDMSVDAKESLNVAEQYPNHVERLLMELETAAVRDRDAEAGN